MGSKTEVVGAGCNPAPFSIQVPYRHVEPTGSSMGTWVSHRKGQSREGERRSEGIATRSPASCPEWGNGPGHPSNPATSTSSAGFRTVTPIGARPVACVGVHPPVHRRSGLPALIEVVFLERLGLVGIELAPSRCGARQPRVSSGSILMVTSRPKPRLRFLRGPSTRPRSSPISGGGSGWNPPRVPVLRNGRSRGGSFLWTPRTSSAPFSHSSAPAHFPP